jgi:hypothetical protein
MKNEDYDRSRYETASESRKKFLRTVLLISAGIALISVIFGSIGLMFDIFLSVIGCMLLYGAFLFSALATEPLAMLYSRPMSTTIFWLAWIIAIAVSVPFGIHTGFIFVGIYSTAIIALLATHIPIWVKE